MVAAMHDKRSMERVFFHVKGGQEFNWKHRSQKKSKGNGEGVSQVWMRCAMPHLNSWRLDM
jgi:hypothetical protein